MGDRDCVLIAAGEPSRRSARGDAAPRLLTPQAIDVLAELGPNG
jgi:hypothetical protein